jgi:hypothetical protein
MRPRRACPDFRIIGYNDDGDGGPAHLHDPVVVVGVVVVHHVEGAFVIAFPDKKDSEDD